MPAATTLPVIAGLAILGAAAGVNLGRAAIADINPAYFDEPETRFHADLTPYRSPDWAQAQPAGYLAAQQPVLVGNLGSGCVGCADYPVEYVPRHEPAVDGHSALYAESAPQPAQIVIVETPAADPGRERIQLYSSYPVSGDEKPAEAVRTAEAPAQEPAAPTGL
jgi:hypothetical protein